MKELKVGQWVSLSRLLSSIPDQHHNQLLDRITEYTIRHSSGFSFYNICRLSNSNKLPVILQGIGGKRKNTPIYNIEVYIDMKLYRQLFGWIFGGSV